MKRAAFEYFIFQLWVCTEKDEEALKKKVLKY